MRCIAVRSKDLVIDVAARRVFLLGEAGRSPGRSSRFCAPGGESPGEPVTCRQLQLSLSGMHLSVAVSLWGSTWAILVASWVTIRITAVTPYGARGLATVSHAKCGSGWPVRRSDPTGCWSRRAVSFR